MPTWTGRFFSHLFDDLSQIVCSKVLFFIGGGLIERQKHYTPDRDVCFTLGQEGFDRGKRTLRSGTLASLREDLH